MSSRLKIRIFQMLLLAALVCGLTRSLAIGIFVFICLVALVTFQHRRDSKLTKAKRQDEERIDLIRHRLFSLGFDVDQSRFQTRVAPLDGHQNITGPSMLSPERAGGLSITLDQAGVELTKQQCPAPVHALVPKSDCAAPAGQARTGSCASPDPARPSAGYRDLVADLR